MVLDVFMCLSAVLKRIKKCGIFTLIMTHKYPKSSYEMHLLLHTFHP